MRNIADPNSDISIKFEFVEHIRRVLSTALASSMHIVRVILLNTAFLVAAECITSQVRVLILKVLLSTVCLFRGRKLSRKQMGQHGHQIKTRGKTNPNQPADKVQRQSIPQHRLNKHPQNKNMDPNHNSLTPSRPTKSQRFSPKLTLIAAHTLNLLPLLLLPTLNILEVTGNPLLLTALVYKLHAVLLERRHGVEGEFAVLGDQLRRARYDHRCNGFVASQEILYLL